MASGRASAVRALSLRSKALDRVRGIDQPADFLRIQSHGIQPQAVSAGGLINADLLSGCRTAVARQNQSGADCGIGTAGFRFASAVHSSQMFQQAAAAGEQRKMPIPPGDGCTVLLGNVVGDEISSFLFAFVCDHFQLFAMDKAKIRHILVRIASDKQDSTQPIIEKTAHRPGGIIPAPCGLLCFYAWFSSRIRANTSVRASDAAASAERMNPA